MEKLKYCRVCLATDTTMYSLDTTMCNKIAEIYLELLQIKICVKDQNVCFECATLMYKYHKFKSKCLRAHVILSEIELDGKQLIKQDIYNIDRKLHKLESNLNFGPVTIWDPCEKDSLVKEIIYPTDIFYSHDLQIKKEIEIEVSDVEKPLNTFEIGFNTETENNPLDVSYVNYITDSSNLKIEKETAIQNDLEIPIKRRTMNFSSDIPRPNIDNVVYISLDKLKSDLYSFQNGQEKTKSDSSDESIITKPTALGITRKRNVKTKNRNRNSNDMPFSNSDNDECISMEKSKINIALSDNPSINAKAIITKQGCVMKRKDKTRRKINKCKSELKLTKTSFCNDTISSKINDNMNKENPKSDSPICPKNNQAEIKTDSSKNNRLKTIKPATARINSRKRKVETQPENINNNSSLSGEKKKRKLPEKEKLRKYEERLLKSTEDYTVIWLTSEDAERELLLRKETDNYKLSQYKCQLCFRGYDSKKTYDNHMDKHSVRHGEYACKLCHMRFIVKKDVRKHFLACHQRKFVCTTCPYVCFNAGQASAHARSHKQKFSCEHCGHLFGAPHSLVVHMRKYHAELVDEAVCELCGNVFTGAGGLNYHTKRVHPQEQNEKLGPECEECGVHFTSATAWKIHLVKSNKHQVENGCGVCGETFPSAEEFKNHMKTHPKPRHYVTNYIKVKGDLKCDMCDMKFVKGSEFKRHVKSEHPADANKLLQSKFKSYVCEFCGKIFMYLSGFLNHRSEHTGERPHQCKTCGKTFRRANELTVHDNVHSKSSAQKCELCGRLLGDKSALRKHILVIHQNKKPFKCDICDKRFLYVSDVRIHVKYTHGARSWPKKKKRCVVKETNASQEQNYH